MASDIPAFRHIRVRLPSYCISTFAPANEVLHEWRRYSINPLLLNAIDAVIIPSGHGTCNCTKMTTEIWFYDSETLAQCNTREYENSSNMIWSSNLVNNSWALKTANSQKKHLSQRCDMSTKVVCRFWKAGINYRHLLSVKTTTSVLYYDGRWCGYLDPYLNSWREIWTNETSRRLRITPFIEDCFTRLMTWNIAACWVFLII